MKKVITAIGNPILNNKIKAEQNIKVVGNDIQYQDGIFEILEIENNIDFLFLSEKINGDFKIEKLVEKIKLINKMINIIIILEEKNEELENLLIAKGVFKIIYHNKIEIKEIINLINQTENKKDENEELKKEINNLKNLIIENKRQEENKKINNLKENNQVTKETIFQKIKNKYIYKNKKNQITDNNFIQKRQTDIISISGPSGVREKYYFSKFSKINDI